MICLNMISSRKLKLKKPLYITIEYDDEEDQYSSFLQEFGISGFGRTEIEAQTDLEHALEEYYFDLKKDKNKLGKGLQTQYNLLKIKIKFK